MELQRILKVLVMFLSGGWVVYFQIVDGLVDQNLSFIHLQIIRPPILYLVTIHNLPKIIFIIKFLQTLKERACVPIYMLFYTCVILYELLLFVFLPLVSFPFFKYSQP